jgi:predicted glycosyltransferase
MALRNKLYYGIKPLIPASARRMVRQVFARKKRQTVSNVWPVLPGSEVPPQGWPGWPEGKKFAFVLSHDVESQSGLDKCRALMELEMKHGFRSSFNFIPEGDYRVSPQFRDELTGNGFEVGVHDLRHDGKLYKNRREFSANAARINRYLKEWGAVGFRAGFMLHNLEWLHDLDVLYDASTFDTDPFEPQPDGAGTIFPFWKAGAAGNGYVELPYTLPQDSTLFLLFREANPDTWLKKLDWVASHGGMALVNVHPDYMRFDGEAPSGKTFPAEFYGQLLQHVRDKYGDSVWLARPRDVAEMLAANQKRKPVLRRGNPSKKIWIDLDNTPHVPLFAPIAAALEKRGYHVILTARDAFQVCELAEKKGLACTRIGKHSGKNKRRKAAGLFLRALQLVPVALREKPVIGLSHGSRSQILACNMLGIPTIMMDDYEFAMTPPMMRPTWFMTPEVISHTAFSHPAEMVLKYPGIKEDVYVPDFKPDPAFLKGLGLSEDELIAVARPPATEAHYHNAEAEVLFSRFMDRACKTDNMRVVLLPRNKAQGAALRNSFPHWFEGRRTIIPEKAVDGLDLIWHSDLVVSGGGTMNREAAAMKVPVYSVFRGTIGAVDKDLKRQGKLTLIESVEDADKIAFARRPRTPLNGTKHSAALSRVVDNIVEIVEDHCGL